MVSISVVSVLFIISLSISSHLQYHTNIPPANAHLEYSLHILINSTVAIIHSYHFKKRTLQQPFAWCRVPILLEHISNVQDQIMNNSFQLLFLKPSPFLLMSHSKKSVYYLVLLKYQLLTVRSFQFSTFRGII